MNKRLHQVKKDFERALGALEKGVAEARTELEIDGVIQRFEFTFELSWKFLRVYLENEGILVNTPRSCMKEAFRLRLLDKEEEGLRMLDDRNDSVHLYDKAASREIFERVRSTYVNLLKDMLERVPG